MRQIGKNVSGSGDSMSGNLSIYFHGGTNGVLTTCGNNNTTAIGLPCRNAINAFKPFRKRRRKIALNRRDSS